MKIKRMCRGLAVVFCAALFALSPTGVPAHAATDNSGGVQFLGLANQSGGYAAVIGSGGGAGNGAHGPPAGIQYDSYDICVIGGGLGAAVGGAGCDPNCNTPVNAAPGVAGHWIMSREVAPVPSDWQQVCWAETGAPNQIVGGTMNPIPPAKIDTIWKEKFLVNADTGFTLEGQNTISQTITVGGVPVSLVSTPKSYLWDFGDGTTSTDPTPSHKWTSTSPDSTHPADHTAHVKLTVVWQNTMTPNGQAAQNIGNITQVAQIDRPIVEVWSTPTNTSD